MSESCENCERWTKLLGLKCGKHSPKSPRPARDPEEVDGEAFRGSEADDFMRESMAAAQRLK